jgi:HEAT repeat protein
MAIANCSVGVVQTLETHMDQAAAKLGFTTPRTTDPTLSKYVAAADLLAGHRSYEAAQVLLRHLLEVRPCGPAGRALVGAVARSPNAALVDGLLNALDGGFDPTGMATAAEVLGWRRERAASPTLRRMVTGDGETRPNPTVRKAAITALGRIGDTEAIPDLINLLDDPNLAEATSVALLLLGEWQGVDHHAQALTQPSPNMSRSLGEIVGRYGGPAYLLLLFRTAELEGAAAIGALQGLGYLGDPRAVPRLIDSLGSRDPNRWKIASGALEIITGHHEDPEESLLRSRWNGWWEKNGGAFEDGARYRLGRPMDPSLLIERMAHDDAQIRRSTYDELVISTGCRLPFDAEGPFRIQVNHQLAWRQWWADNTENFPMGRWSFHGEIIG